jgi:ubiquitin-like-conjugating enzyme ATG3
LLSWYIQELTPKEFLLAGDFLVQCCPTWTWEGGDEAKRREFLPPNKQYLITRNVPCLKRASAVEEYAETLGTNNLDHEEVEGGEWVATSSTADDEEDFEVLPSSSRHRSGMVAEIEAEDIVSEQHPMENKIEQKQTPNQTFSYDIPDISDLSVENIEQDDAVAPLAPATAEGAAPNTGGQQYPSGVLQTRTYDVIISYDKFGRVPRVWLLGYDEHRSPLSPDAVLDDVMEDYRRKTVDIASHPHRTGAGQVVSIHPCRHAQTMHRLAHVLADSGQEFKVEHYMVMFLKFISGVVPTIEYDFTYSV